VVAEQVSVVNYFWVDSWSQPGATAPCHIMKQLTRPKLGLTYAALACSWPMYGDPCFDTGVRKGARPGPFVSPLFFSIFRSAKATVHRHRERFVLRSALNNGSCVFAAGSAIHDETRQVRNMIHAHVMTTKAANTANWSTKTESIL
jgi:hypothetical protein